jgi:hypothetical protein
MTPSRTGQESELRAEILKLARLLGLSPDELGYLTGVDVDDLRQLREQVTELLFDSHLGVLRRLAAASRLLPVTLVAQMGEKAFGPLLSARITGLLDPDKAVDMAAHLPVSFLADVAVELDPRRAGEVIARIPPERIGAVSAELVRRGEYVTMGRFVGHLPDASIQAALGTSGPADTLQVALVLENRDGLEHLVGLLGPERIQGILAAADEAGLRQEAEELLDRAGVTRPGGEARRRRARARARPES